MPSPVASLAIIREIISLLNKLNPLAQIERVKVSQAMQSLKEIVFFDGEVMGTLKEIESGHSVDREIAEFYAENFRRMSDNVARSLEFLDPRRFEDVERITISEAQALERIRYGKVGARQAVAEIFMDYLRADQAGDERRLERLRIEASNVVSQLERLNRELDAASRRLARLRRQ